VKIFGKVSILIFAVIMSVTVSHAQVTVSGSNVQDVSGVPLYSGQWCAGATCLTVSNGAFSGSVTAGTYTVTVVNASSVTILSVSGVVISGTSYNWNLYTVPYNVTFSGNGQPYLGCQLAAKYTQGDSIPSGAIWSCIAQNGQLVWKRQGPPSPSGPGLISGLGVPTLSAVVPTIFIRTDTPQQYSLSGATGAISSTWTLISNGTINLASPGPIGQTTPNIAAFTNSTTSQVPEANVMSPAYGAKGDCTTDDTSAIQAAFPSTCSGDLGYPVYFPPPPGGCYKISNTININPTCTPHVRGDGFVSQIDQTAVNKPIFTVACATQCEVGPYTIDHLNFVEATGTTNGADAVLVTGPYPASGAWNGDHFYLTNSQITGFKNGVRINGWANSTLDYVHRANPYTTGAVAVTAGSSTSTTTTLTVASVPAGVTTGSSVWVLGAEPAGYNSPIGIESGYFRTGSGTYTGAAGQTCVLSNFGNNGGNLTSTATVALTGTNTIANGTPLVITNPGVVLDGGYYNAVLSSGTATCSGVAFVTIDVGPAPYTVTAVSGLNITMNNANNPGAFVSSSAALMSAQPGYGLVTEGPSGNSMHIRLNEECSPDTFPYNAGAVALNQVGIGVNIEEGDVDGCYSDLMANNANGVTLIMDDIEGSTGPWVTDWGGANVIVISDGGAQSYAPLASPFQVNGATLTIIGMNPLSGLSAPLVTANHCYYVRTYSPLGTGALTSPGENETCLETSHGQVSMLGTLPAYPTNSPGTVPPAPTTYARGALALGLDYTGTLDDQLYFYRQHTGTVIRDTLVPATSPTVSNLTDTGTTNLEIVASGAWNGSPVANNYLVNPSMMIGGVSCTLGGSCAPGVLTGGFLNGFKELCTVGQSTAFACLGNGLANLTGTSDSATTPTATAPIMLKATSTSAAGASAGWESSFATFFSAQQPTATWMVGYSATSDYTANARIWLGLAQYTCTPATLTASDNPACNYAAIRYSTTAPDTYYQCVTGNGTAQTVTPIGTTAPSLTPTTMSVGWNGAGNVVCTVGSTSVTVSTTLPFAGNGDQVIFANTYPGGGVTHLELYGYQGVSANSPF
jgi:hypothetical protein